MTEVLEVEPLGGPVHASVRLPGSKSITNRALVCAALARGTSRLSGVLDAEDTAAMIDGLRALGVTIDRSGDEAVVTGVAGRVHAGSGARVDARLSGTTSRFLLAVSLLADGPTTIDGGAPLRERPMADGFAALRALGARVDAVDDRLPATVLPTGRPGGHVVVAGSASSQFLSGLLLAGPCVGMEVEVDGVLRSAPYVDMTLAVMRAFGAVVEVGAPGARYTVAGDGYRATDYSVEPDASAASYFFAAAAVCGGEVTVDGLGASSLQGDVRFVEVLAEMGVEVEQDATRTVVRSDGRLRGVTVDMADISDTVQTLAAIAPFADAPTTIEGVGFIRGKETDRIGSTVSELRRCGVDAEELPDGIRIRPGKPRPARIRTYDDHRMAMSFAVMGLRTPGIRIEDPGCVAKTFPGFWDALEQLRRRA